MTARAAHEFFQFASAVSGEEPGGYDAPAGSAPADFQCPLPPAPERAAVGGLGANRRFANIVVVLSVACELLTRRTLDAAGIAEIIANADCRGSSSAAVTLIG